MNQPTVPTRSENTSSNTLRALPTYYEGVTFRSRLEARWAIVFDRLNIPWEYEKEGYALPAGNYLPDFWLPTVRGGMWFEVKGQEPTEHENQLAEELCLATHSDVAIAFGPIQDEVWNANDGAYIYMYDDASWIWDNYHRFVVCPSCRKVGFESMDHVGRLDCPCALGREQRPSHPRLHFALEAGRTARFNNGHHATARSHK